MSKLYQALKMAMAAIVSNKMRSFLTMLGIIIGVLSVTVLVGIAQGTTGQVTDQINSLGSNMITVNLRGRRTMTMTLDEIMDLRGKGSVKKTAPTISATLTTKAGINTHETTVYGTTDGYEEIRGYNVAVGRFLTESDVEKRSAVCVVGVDVADELFGQRNVVGEEIRIDGRKYQIIGVFEEKGAVIGMSQDDNVVIPITLAQRSFRSTNISMFYANANSEEEDIVKAAVTTLENYMQKKTNDSDAYTVSSQAQLLETVSSIAGIMTGMLAGIAGISLLVGGIGIMNIMLVSVSERTREIGIRKAIGAQRLDIMMQFIIEAVMISLAGGLIGLGLGFATKTFLAPMFNLTMTISSAVASFSLLFSVAIGVLFGSFPAYKAAQLLPIDALRYE